jgi:oryzin
MQLFARVLALAATAVPFFAQAAPLSKHSSDPIPGKYIVLLQPETNISSVAAHHSKVRELHRRNLARRDIDGIEREYDLGDFKGYAGAFDDATIEELKALPEVRQIKLYHISSKKAPHIYSCT